MFLLSAVGGKRHFVVQLSIWLSITVEAYILVACVEACLLFSCCKLKKEPLIQLVDIPPVGFY